MKKCLIYLKQSIFKIKIKKQVCKEGLEDIKLNLILQNINEYANKKDTNKM